MSTTSSSSQSRMANHRISSIQSIDRVEPRISRARPRSVEFFDVYIHTLSAAYLHHLLQPRAKRKQYVTPVVAKSHKRSNTSSTTLDRFVTDKIAEFGKIHKAKSKTTFPHNFMDLLSRRMMLVVQGKETCVAYSDRVARVVFAEAYNAFTDDAFLKMMAKDRHVEALIAIFYSKAVAALQKEGDPEDTTSNIRAFPYLALFVRLIINILRDERKDKDRPELMNQLAELEKGLLTNSEDLASGMGERGSKNSNTIEVEVPLSQDVKDMKMVQIVAQIFGKQPSEVQEDLNGNRKLWTEDAALADLKSYNHCLNTASARTSRSEDFDLEEAYQAWKKAEVPEVTQLMADVIRAKAKGARFGTGTDKLLLMTSPTSAQSSDKVFADPSKWVSSPIADLATPMSSANAIASSLDQPFDMSSLSLKDDQPSRLHHAESTFTFIPPDPRAFYRAVLRHAMLYDRMHSTQASDPPLSRQSLELLTELAVRWRVPHFSRLVLFIDVVSERFKDEDFTVDDLDIAFKFVETMVQDTKKHGSRPQFLGPASKDQSQWTISDFALYRQSLSNLYDELLRELCGLLRLSYEPKLPKGWSPGGVLQVLEDYITSDPSFSKSAEEIDRKTNELAEGLTEQAQQIYVNCRDELPKSRHEWEFYHVIQFGQTVVQLHEKVQKRYRNNPKVMGVTPVMILVETMFPLFEQDAFQMIEDIKEVAKENGQHIDMDDGFALYRELVKIRSIHQEVLPTPFAFNIEDTLSEFVWQYIQVADANMIKFVENAIAQDDFQVRSLHPDPNEPGWEPPSDDERHSVSVIDIFSLLNQTVDGIYKLEWHEHDDVGYAKFMTALAKSFVQGLARYCEVLEQQFKKEMDRPSPAQEVAATQSKQEKWLQLAKDTWNSKERIEPFQFYPASFVKLNNIEYAIQQLDKLEQYINVDACADVLKRIAAMTPPQRKQRRVNRYVFTIKVVEAEDLQACDANGLSDPYVILGDEKQRRLHKTRVIDKSLNPRWDESVDVNVTGPTNIVATVWDNDLIGEDDFVGRTSLKLDPIHFSDYLPREYWLDLDTKGRLLVRVSMEGERDDIEFYFAKAFRLLKRTERDMTRSITDKLSQYINSSLSMDTINRLLSRGISMAAVTNIWKKQALAAPAPTQAEIRAALDPLCDYFNENFAVMKNTLTDQSMIMVMARVWKEVLMTIDGLFLPPLSEKPSAKRPLNDKEFHIVVDWLEHMLHFFEAKDEKTGEVMGVPSDILRSPKYSEIASMAFHYFETTDNLIRASEQMASTTLQQVRDQRKRFTAPATLGPSFGSTGLSGASVRRAKSIMTSRNLGTMRKAKAEKWKQLQEQPNDDLILRILRMRPEAADYLRERSRQKQRLAATAAADKIVMESLAGGGVVRLGGFGAGRR